MMSRSIVLYYTATWEIHVRLPYAGRSRWAMVLVISMSLWARQVLQTCLAPWSKTARFLIYEIWNGTSHFEWSYSSPKYCHELGAYNSCMNMSFLLDRTYRSFFLINWFEYQRPLSHFSLFNSRSSKCIAPALPRQFIKCECLKSTLI